MRRWLSVHPQLGYGLREWGKKQNYNTRLEIKWQISPSTMENRCTFRIRESNLSKNSLTFFFGWELQAWQFDWTEKWREEKLVDYKRMSKKKKKSICAIIVNVSYILGITEVQTFFLNGWNSCFVSVVTLKLLIFVQMFVMLYSQWGGF